VCGIFGLVTPGLPVDAQACWSATQTLSHRGPDGSGFALGKFDDASSSVVRNRESRDFYLDGSSPQADWCLGHRRLAILDLSVQAAQPMCNEDRTCWVVFNGEIYNHRQLRTALEKRGHRFLTDHSDTEVLVHGYEEWGDGLVEHLRGMFAFGILDVSSRCVFLARDHFGEKPLYYAADARGLAFSSEPRALIASGFASNNIDGASVSDYLTFGYVPAPRTVFADIRKLRAAERATVKLDRSRSLNHRRFWDLKYDPQPVADPRKWQDEFDALLCDAVRVRLESDVPLGAFLSGGLDSTTVVQKMASVGAHPRTFTIAFAETAFDESAFANRVAAHFHVAHQVETVEPTSLIRLIEVLPAVFDEPFADASALPMLALARLAREHVVVALSGDGGDELLGGYTRYQLNSTLERVFSGSFGGMAEICGAALNRVWPDSVKGRGLVRLLRGGGHERYQRLVSDNWLARHTILGQSDLSAFAAAWDEGTPGLENRMCKADLRLYLPEDLMTKVDRCCMSVGLEPRAPFLDRQLFEFVAKAPTGMKGSGRDAKRPLRDTLDGPFGREFTGRPKQGFAVPLGLWFRTELRDFVGDMLNGSHTLVGQLFPRGFVRGLFESHLHGSRDLSARLWTVLLLELWHRRFGGSITTEAAVA
jgi:asparagine synthase (glutamine-hydrolysing)